MGLNPRIYWMLEGKLSPSPRISLHNPRLNLVVLIAELGSSFLSILSFIAVCLLLMQFDHHRMFRSRRQVGRGI